MVLFKPFKEKHYIQMVKFGYDITGSCVKDLDYLRSYYSKNNVTAGSWKDWVIRQFKQRENESFSFFLSGGLDSSFLFALFIESRSKAKYEILTIENGDDEEYVNILLKHLNCIKEPVRVSRSVITDDTLCKMMKSQRSPMDLGSMQCNFDLFWAANNDVVVTGDGADEIFGGYDRHQYYDTHKHDVEYELFVYHIPRVENMASYFGKEVFTPYLRLTESDLFFPGKIILKNWAGPFLPKEILERKKVPLKSEDAKKGIAYRAHLVDLWKRYLV